MPPLCGGRSKEREVELQADEGQHGDGLLNGTFRSMSIKTKEERSLISQTQEVHSSWQQGVELIVLNWANWLLAQL